MNNNEEVVYDNNGEIKYITLSCLVDNIITRSDTKTISSILHNYPLDISKKELLNIFIDKLFYLCPSNPNDNEVQAVKLRILSFLRIWIRKRRYDFDNPEFKEYFDFCLSEYFTKLYSTRMIQILQRILNRKDDNPGLVFRQSIPPIMKNTDNINSIYNCDHMETARQLCLCTFNIFSTIKTDEFLSYTYPSKNIGHDNLSTLLRIHNNIIDTISCITNENYLEFWVSVAKDCFDCNNFQISYSILKGIEENTNILISNENQKAIISQLQNYFSSTFSYKEYRIHLYSCNPPCIIMIQVPLTDLKLIYEGENQVLPQDHINFKLYSFNSNVLSKYLQYQDISYNYTTIDRIQDLIKQLFNV